MGKPSIFVRIQLEVERLANTRLYPSAFREFLHQEYLSTFERNARCLPSDRRMFRHREVDVHECHIHIDELQPLCFFIWEIR